MLVQQPFYLLAALLLGGCQLASELIDAVLVQALQLLFQLEGAVLKRSQPAGQVLIYIAGPASCRECRYSLRPLCLQSLLVHLAEMLCTFNSPRLPSFSPIQRWRAAAICHRGGRWFECYEYHSLRYIAESGTCFSGTPSMGCKCCSPGAQRHTL